MKSLFIFRRDLRIEDNTGLNNCKGEAIPCFTLDPRQTGNHKYKSENGLQFMIKSLVELNKELEKKGSKLHLFKGKAEEVIKEIIEENKIEEIVVNQDYTPFSIKRDKKIKKICEKNKIEFKSYHDSMLTTPGTVLKNNGEPYTVYTPFSRKAREQTIRKPNTKEIKFYKGKIKGTIKIEEVEVKKNPNILVKGGRKEGLKLLKEVENLSNYKEIRDYPSIKGTSKLSAHNKFGTISIREAYWKIKENFTEYHTLINELYWRDFYTHIAFHFPKVFGKNFQEKYDKIKWEENKEQYKKWKEGKTGFPIIDAGMRELNQTGYMHNRVRMIVASFLTKDLRIDWRKGEEYFAQKLTDYDPCVNNGSWQWAASTGCDAQPYFRIFNPWLQQKKFDPEAKYIKKWIPELKEIETKEIHELDKKRPEGLKYPEPIIDHQEEKTKTLAMFKKM